MKQTINLGAFGWRHRHWLNTFYPEDLPVADDRCDEDWRLAYYSNEFNTVLVPAQYWQTARAEECEEWLESVHADFHFFVQINASMLDNISMSDLSLALTRLAPQLSAFVFLHDDQALPADITRQFIQLADSLQVDIIGDVSVPGTDSTTGSSERAARSIWLPKERNDSRFAFIEDDLSDLRSVRIMVEQFVADQPVSQSSEIIDSTIIVKHPHLQVEHLSQFRVVLDVMGY